MSFDPAVGDLVRQLSRVGLRPEPRLVERILANGAAARPELLKLAMHIEALHDEDINKALGPLHALRLLGEVPDAAIIEPLLSNIPLEVYDDEDVPTQLYGAEILQIIARVGAPAIPILSAIADDPARSEMQRLAAVRALAYVAAYVPEVRDEVISFCRERMESVDLVSAAAAVLAELADKESYQAIMAAYREGRIPQEYTPASAARQYLLGGGRKELNCVAHPLWERYDHHGPTFQNR
ncbi:MAG: hypothetical protein HC822_10845 [Oscillochloris sp.]|nr:hypothetical protein [Oscillochloris sp.]